MSVVARGVNGLENATIVELATDQLETLLSIPGDLSVNELGLDPMWNPLRAVPRFQELLGT